MTDARPAGVNWVLEDEAEKVLASPDYPSASLWTIEQALSWVVNSGRKPEISVFPLASKLSAEILYPRNLAGAANRLWGALCSGTLVAKRVQGDVWLGVAQDTWRAGGSFYVLANFADCYVEANKLKELFAAKRGRPRGKPASPEDTAAMEKWIAEALKADPERGVNKAWKAYKEQFGENRLAKEKHFIPTYFRMKPPPVR